MASGAAQLVRVALFRSRPASTGRTRLGRECDAFDFRSLGAHFKSAGHDCLAGMWIGPDRCFCVAVLKQISLKTAALVVLVLAPCLAVLCQWINYGYFPIFIQLQLGITSAIVGALCGLAFRRSWIASGVLAVLLAGLYLWGTSTSISDDLAEDARATGEYLLANADAVPSGDEGFAKLLELAFSICG